MDRAHLLRRLGRSRAAEEAWLALAAGPGRTAVVAWIEVAKLREHRLGDRPGALEAATRGLAAVDRRRALGLPEPALEANLRRRIERLRRPGSRRRATPVGHDLAGLGRNDEAPNALPDGARSHGGEIRDAGEARSLHGQ